jgi:hypothetical protein
MCLCVVCHLVFCVRLFVCFVTAVSLRVFDCVLCDSLVFVCDCFCVV